MADLNQERGFNRRATAREAALAELEEATLACGESMTAPQREALMARLTSHVLERRRDPAARRFFEEDDQRRLESLVAWVARMRAVYSTPSSND